MNRTFLAAIIRRRPLWLIGEADPELLGIGPLGFRLRVPSPDGGSIVALLIGAPIGAFGLQHRSVIRGGRVDRRADPRNAPPLRPSRPVVGRVSRS